MSHHCSPTRLSRTHLQMVVAVMQQLERSFQLSLPYTLRFISTETVLFGLPKDADIAQNRTPYLELRVLGPGIGDYYSGGIEYQDLLTLHHAQDHQGRRLSLDFEHMSTTLAGDCSRFDSSSLSERALTDFAQACYSFWRENHPLPKEYEAMIDQIIAPSTTSANG